MKIILSNRVESVTGSLGRGFGYAIVKRGNEFYSQRSSKGDVPPDGHWRFIVACAELAKNGLHIADIRLTGYELAEALEEAGIEWRRRIVLNGEYNADEVRKFKIMSCL